DPVEEALHTLQRLGPGGLHTDAGERACTVLYRTMLGLGIPMCRQLGLDDQQLANALHPRFVRFVVGDVHTLAATRATFGAWMRRVCWNALLNELRDERSHASRLRPLDASLPARTMRPTDPIAEGDWRSLVQSLESPDVELARLDAECVAARLRALPARDAVITEMKVFGYTADEIARVLNIAAAAVN